MKTTRVLPQLKAALAITAVTVVAAMATAAPAVAADMKGEYGARTVGSYPAVPVPAPIPVPEMYNWYVRGDIGYALKSTGSLSATGGPQVTLIPSEDRDGPWHGGLGMGRYLTPSLRAEFGFELRNEQTIGKPATYNFEVTTPAVAPATGVDTHTFSADRRDTTNLGSHTFMANLYYDVKTGTRFTPYIGAGAGLSLAVMKRRFSESAQCLSTINSDSLAYFPGCNGNQPVTSPTGFQKIENRWGPALALMLGTAVDVAPGVKFDAGYRLIWQASEPSITMGSAWGAESKIEAGARTDHELRMGVRWDIW